MNDKDVFSQRLELGIKQGSSEFLTCLESSIRVRCDFENQYPKWKLNRTGASVEVVEPVLMWTWAVGLYVTTFGGVDQLTFAAGYSRRSWIGRAFEQPGCLLWALTGPFLAIPLLIVFWSDQVNSNRELRRQELISLFTMAINEAKQSGDALGEPGPSSTASDQGLSL